MSLKLIRPGKRKGNKHWLVRGSLNGRLYEVSTGESDKAAAERRKAEIELALLNDEPAGSAQPVRTFEEAARAYERFKPQSQNSRRYIGNLIARIGTMQLSEIQHNHLVDAAEQIYPGAEPATKNRQVFVPAAAILHYAAKLGCIPYARVTKLKEKKPRTRSVSESDTDRLIQAAESDIEIQTLLIFLFNQGWRITETLALPWSRVDLENGLVEMYVSKTDEWLWRALHDDVVAALRKLETKSSELVFPWPDRGAVYGRLKPIVEATSITFTPHMARHSFATHLRRLGVDLQSIAEAGGWSNLKSVVRYDGAYTDSQKATISKLRRNITGESATGENSMGKKPGKRRARA